MGIYVEGYYRKQTIKVYGQDGHPGYFTWEPRLVWVRGYYKETKS